MSEKQIIHFLHNGKTGGTAVKHAIEQYGVDAKYEMCIPTVGTHD